MEHRDALRDFTRRESTWPDLCQIRMQELQSGLGPTKQKYVMWQKLFCYFDIWHVAKAICKEVCAAGKEKSLKNCSVALEE